MADTIVNPLNPSVGNSIQDHTLQRTFRDALAPHTIFRMEAIREPWPANLGATHTFTRRGRIEPTTRPLLPGKDPEPSTVGSEQWEATAAQWGDTVDTSMPTSYVTLASQYISNMHALGVSAGMSVNRIVRDKLYNAYVSGNSVIDVNASSTATTVHVVNLVGFTRALFQGRPALVSPTNPINISIPAQASTPYVGQVTGFTPDVAGDEIHGGTLTISPALAGNVTARAAIIATNASVVVYSGGGTSVDDIITTDTFTLKDVRSAVSQLQFTTVPEFEDEAFHMHLDPFSVAQIFSDLEFQRLNRGLPDYVHYRRFAIGHLLGVNFYRNTETPYFSTVSTSLTRGNTHGFELTNGAGIKIHRPILTGMGPIEERYLDESKFISEAGVLGRIGEFAVVNGGLQVMTEGIRLTLRAPLDRLQQLTATTWSISGDWAVPTDELAPETPAKYKRAVVCIHGE